MNTYALHTIKELSEKLSSGIARSLPAEQIAEHLSMCATLRRHLGLDAVELFETFEKDMLPSIVDEAQAKLAKEAIKLAIYWSKLDAGVDEEAALAELESDEGIGAVQVVQDQVETAILGWDRPQAACFKTSFEVEREPSLPPAIAIGISRNIAKMSSDLMRSAHKIDVPDSVLTKAPQPSDASGGVRSAHPGSSPGLSTFGTGPPRRD